MIFVSSWPARPTNGSPWMSSSAPGASPTNIRSAFGLPTPKTTCLRPSVCSLQRVQSARARRGSPPMPRQATRTAARVAGSDGSAGRRSGGSAAARRVRIGARSPFAARGGRRRRRARRRTRDGRSQSSFTGHRRQARGAPRGVRARSSCSTRSRIAAATPCLALQRNACSPSCADDRHGVGVDVEARAGLRHVVGHDQIDALAHALLARPGAADRRSPRRSRRARRRRAPRRRRARGRRGCPACAPASASAARRSWRSSRPPRRRRRVVGDGGRHDDDVGCSAAAHHRRVHLGGAADPRRRRRPRAARCVVGPATSVTCAPRACASAASAKPMRPLERLPT